MIRYLTLQPFSIGLQMRQFLRGGCGIRISLSDGRTCYNRHDCVLLASVVNKRYSAMIVMLMFVFISYALSNLAWSEGISAFDISTGGPYEFSAISKIVYLLDPITLKQGRLNVLCIHNTEDVFYQNYYNIVDGASKVLYVFSAFVALSATNVYALHRKHR